MTDEELRKLCEAAPARIRANPFNPDAEMDGAQFYAIARIALPALLARAQAAEGEVERLRTVAQNIEGQRHAAVVADIEHEKQAGLLGIEVQRLTARLRKCEAERDAAGCAVLRPLTEREVQAALHEGRAESMAATGDNAWSSLLADRDKLRALLAEAVGIAGLQDDEVTPEIRDRLAAIAREGGLM